MKTSLITRNPTDVDLADANADSDSFESLSFESKGGTLTFSRSIQGSLPPKAYAATARMAGRLHAANVSENEMNSLLRERSMLLDKKLDGTISKREANRLEYVRWSLDRIEDARYGACLDRLLEAVQMQEELGAKIESLNIQLNELLKRKK